MTPAQYPSDTLTDRQTGKVLVKRRGAEFRERYEIATDPQQYFGATSNAASQSRRRALRGDRHPGGVLVLPAQYPSDILAGRQTGKMLFYRPAAEFRERYEIATAPQRYFDESATAIERLSRDVARSVEAFQ